VIVEPDPKYPQKYLIQFTQDSCDIIDGFNKNDEVVINVNIRGTEWLDPKTQKVRYFCNLNGWSIRHVDNHKQAESLANENNENIPTEEDDDLPF
jgi:hypothetical protein